MATIGERIREARLANNMTQSELAAKVGLKFSAIHKYEAGLVVNLKRDTISALAIALDVSPSWLMCLDDNMAGVVSSEKKPDPQTGSLSPTKQRLLDAVDDLTDSQIDKLLGIISEAKKLL